MNSTDLLVPNPKQLEQLQFEILATCAGFFATASDLRSAVQKLGEAGCSQRSIDAGVSFFIIPANTKWDGPLKMEYPDNASFRLTKLGTI